VALQRTAGNRATSDLLRGGTPGSAPPGAAPIVYELPLGSGTPLDGATRAEMASRFGQDFGDVRVHTDARAAVSARAMRAAAYTVGHDIVFGRDRFAPDEPDGRRLLAHELAHVVQQRRPRTAAFTDAGAEAEAARAGAQAASGRSVTVQAAAAVGVQCEPDDEEERPPAQRKPAEKLPPEGTRERTERSETSRHTSRIGETVEESKAEGHHALPKFLGGRKTQDLVDMPYELHYDYHQELKLVLEMEFRRLGKLPEKGRISYRRFGKLFNTLSEQEQDQVLQKVLEHAEAFDNRETQSKQKYKDLYRSKNTLAGRMREEIKAAKTAQATKAATRAKRGRGGGGTSGQRGGSSPAGGTGAPPSPSQAPTTTAPPARAPTAEAPATEASTTKPPAAKPPTAKAPTAKAPTAAPPAKAPTAKAPTAKAPTAKAPTAKAPAAKAPASPHPTVKATTPKAKSVVAPSRPSGGAGGKVASTAATTAQRTYVGLAGHYSSQLYQIAAEQTKDKEMVDAINDMNKLMDAHAFVENPKQFTAQYLADYMIGGAFNKLAQQLAAGEAQFFSTYPEVQSFYTQPLGYGLSLNALQEGYDKAARNLRLPNARKVLATIFMMLDITDQTPRADIDRRVQVINQYLARQPGIGTYVQAFDEAKRGLAFGLTVLRMKMDNLQQQLGELPAGFADEIRRRGDALVKVSRLLDDYYNKVIYLSALPGGDTVVFFLGRLRDGFAGLGGELHWFAERAGARRAEYEQEIQRLEERANQLEKVRGAFDVM